MKVGRFVILFITTFFLSSCVVTQSLDFSNNAGETDLEASDFLVSVIEDLSCWTGTDSSDAFFDVAVTGVAKSIASSDFSKYVYIDKDDNGHYQISFGFFDFESLIKQLGGKNQNVVTLETENGLSKLSFNLSMENYDSIKKMIPLLTDPNFEAYGPVYNNPPYDYRTEEDYIYMMEFIFGEGAGTIADSTITFVINTPSAIIETSGEKLSETCSTFKFRLIDFLLLHEPITFFCTY